jgi:EAL domain-containing protein (putative c-di-GMP-specific phosphodiesterase class I)
MNTANHSSGETPAILVVDDDVVLLRSMQRGLSMRGFNVTTAPHGHEAVAKIAAGQFEAIVCDIAMPDMDGIELLRTIRAHDLDVPVLLVTGQPTLDSALRAMDFGAFQYLLKPIDIDRLVNELGKAVRMHRLARLKRQAHEIATGAEGVLPADRAGLETVFNRALEGLWIAYQPIVSSQDGSIKAYEALMRLTEPGVPHPGAMLQIAEQLERLEVLGRTVRERVATPMHRASQGVSLFVNLHPAELFDPELTSPNTALSRMARRVVFEITERAALERFGATRERIAEVRNAGFRIAVDDLGAGYSGLSTFAQLEPDFVKLDMSLVRDVHNNATKQRVIRSMAGLCRELGMEVIAEGVEERAERDVLRDLGCDLLQGYYIAKPGPAFPEVHW